MTTGQTLVDRWTMAHVGLGVAAGAVGLNPGAWLVLSVGWEIFEHHLESTPTGQRIFDSSGPEAPHNAAADVVANMLGWWIGDRQRPAMQRWADRAA